MPCRALSACPAIFRPVLLLLAIVAAAPAAFADPGPGPVPGFGDRFGPGSWRIVAVAGMELPADGHTVPSFDVGMDMESFSATIGCNRFGASMAIDGNAITIGPVMATRMACPPPLDMLEAGLAEALPDIRAFAEDGGMVTLVDAQGQALIILIPPSGG